MNIVGRRELIGGSLGLGLVGAAAPLLAAGPGRKPLDFSRQDDRQHAYMMMRGALDDQLVIGCVSGRYYGVVDDELTPLFGVVSATFSRYRRLPDGAYEAVNVEYAYFTDPETGKAMGPFRNPYTGQVVEVPGSGYAPAKITILPNLDLKLQREIPGLQFEHRVGPFEARGDDVWVTEVTRTSSIKPGATKPFRYSEVVTLHARRSELETAGAVRATCETSFTNVVGWRPWLKMGDHPGHMMSVGAGRYGAAIEELPPAWIEATRAQRPELLKDPAAVLAPLWNAK